MSFKEKWIEHVLSDGDSQCRELEELEKRGRSDLMYSKVKELCQRDRGGKKQESMLSKDETLLTDSGNVKERWQEYIEDLYAKDEKPIYIPLEKDEVSKDNLGPELLREEIIKVIQHLEYSTIYR